MATTDEIHLKGFEAGATVTITLIPGNATHAAVNVDGVPVAIGHFCTIVASCTGDPILTDPVVGKSKVEAIIDALGKDDAVSNGRLRCSQVQFKLSLRTACGFR